MAQACRHCRTNLLRFTTRRREARTRVPQAGARACEDLPRVRLGLADAAGDHIEVELEHLTQQEDRALGRRELLEHDKKCSRQRQRELRRFLIRCGQRFGEPRSGVLEAPPLGAAMVVRHARVETDVGVLVLARPPPSAL